MNTNELAGWLAEKSIEQLQGAMQSGEVTALDLVLGYMERIAQLDSGGPGLNSVLEINPDAEYIAAALDVERAAKGPRGPLHGIPVLLKDNIDTNDKLHTSAGSRALADWYAPEDSHVAARLRQAGAVILGKANMTEWANFMTKDMPAGYSSRGGQVKNPYGLGVFSPGGSSSGSGASVAASICSVSVGTETSGSILSPATCNSVVGIKPTVGLVSRRGVIPIMFSQDTPGPFGRTVEDAAVLLGALAGADEHDAASLAHATARDADYTQYLDPKALQGARLGVPREAFEAADDQWKAAMEHVLKELKDLGATVVDPVPLEAARPSLNQTTTMMYEFKPALNAYLKRLGPGFPRTLRELIAFNSTDPERMLRFGQYWLEAADATSGTLTEPEYIRARAEDIRVSRTEGIDRALTSFELDALVLPGTFGCAVAARAGYPSVNLPAGYLTDGMPFGLTFTGGAYAEPKLIALAYAYERATLHRRPPAFGQDA